MNTKSIPIFDSLTHPILNQAGDNETNIHYLIQSMQEENIQGAFAMESSFDAYHEDYAYSISRIAPNIFPVHLYNPDGLEIAGNSAKRYIMDIKNKGYCGIKIHPRHMKLDVFDGSIEMVLRTAGEAGLSVFICTYLYSDIYTCYYQLVDKLIDLIHRLKETKIVLLHSGGVNLLESMEIARAYKNILLDLSFTLCKYKGSSLDLDLKFMFNSFDRRICIGSDSPSYSMETLRKRFEELGEGVPHEKLENIAYKNLVDFTGTGGDINWSEI